MSTSDSSNQSKVIDLHKMVSSMSREIDSYWSEYESDNAIKPFLIHRVPRHILKLDRDSYEPIIISIGPHHHGAPNLLEMQKEKWNCLDFILKLNCELRLQDYIRAIVKLQKKVRSCYSAEIAMDKLKFLQMLLLDSCFILVKVEGTVVAELASKGAQSGVAIQNDEEGRAYSGQLTESVSRVHGHDMGNMVQEIELTKNNMKKNDKNSDFSDQHAVGDWYSSSAWHDLFLLENQIPFFVVETVYDLVISKAIAKVVLRDKIVECVEDILRHFPKGVEESKRPKNYHHLLHLCHMYFRPTQKVTEKHGHDPKFRYFHHLVNLGQKYFHVPKQQETSEHLLHGTLDDCFQAGHLPTRWRQAIQYHEAGVGVRRREYSCSDRHSLLDIKFRNGVLEVPCFPIDENTESLFKNLIAFEQTDPQFGNDVTAYVIFMSQFVSTVQDASLLTQRGIIVHMLDGDDELPALFNRLSKQVSFASDCNYYLKTLSYILEAHYQSRLSRWIAWLWRNHFSNPWLALTVFAAVIVLMCTIVQTVFTVLAYIYPQ